MGNAFEQATGQTSQPNQPVARPLPEIPQPIQDVRTNGTHGAVEDITPGNPRNQADLDLMSVHDSGEQNAFTQATAQSGNTVTSPVTGAVSNTPPADESSDTMKYLKKIWGQAGEFVGEHVPQAATGPLAFATHNIIEPYNESMAWATKTSGELAEKAAVLGTPYTVEQAREKFPRTMGMTGAIAETVGGLVADPRNWPLMAESAAKPMIKRLMSGAFAAQMGSGVKDQAQQLAENWDNLTPYERWKQGTSLGLGSAMTVGAASHAAFGEATPTKQTPGTEPGPKKLIRPTTVKTAGVEAPIPAKLLVGANAFTKAASDLLSTPGSANEFQNEQTKPAATRQMVSSLSQSATDKIAAHEALANGEAAPPPISGTQTPGVHTTPDKIWQAMQESAGKTWDKARDASAAEQSEWNRARLAAEQEHQAAIDKHNQTVAEYNADPENAGNKMEPLQYDPTDANVPEKPPTYDELKATLDAAKERLGDQNTEIRQKARDVEVPKAEKAMDSWFNDHEDEVSPHEYESAKKLWADSERFKEISNALRVKLAQGTLSANDLKGLEARIDGKSMKRRGAAGDGEFQRLLGPETYANFKNVTKLFEPFEKTSPLAMVKSWGLYALKGLAAGILGGHSGGYGGELGAGIGAEYVFHKIAQNILFNPEFGSSFTRLVEATKSAYSKGTSVSADVLGEVKDKLKQLWKDQSGEMVIPGTGGRKPAGPKFDLQDNGPDENGDQSHILGISHNGEHVGHLNISQKTPDSWTVNDASIRSDKQGKGFGTAAYEHAFKEAASRGMKTVESDISTTKAAAKTWDSLMRKYPDAITEENGQYTADLSKMGTNPVEQVANDYNKSVGRPALDNTKVEPDARRQQIADSFDAMKHDPNDPKVKASYQALTDELQAQKKFLESKGYTFSLSDTDPYKSYEEMRDDIKNNKHITVWTGGNPLPEDHPLAQKLGDGWDGNTLLRAVHDVMGHAAGDNDFSEKGEENAYQLHKQSFSKEALPALTTETKGQTSWFFNHEGVRNGEAPGRFAEQKAGILPSNSESVLNHIKSDKPFAVLTAENPQNGRLSDAENKQLNDRMVAELRKDGFHPVEVEGHNQDVEGQKEHSFFVPDMSPEDAARYGRKYKQTAVLTQEGLHDLNRDVVNPSENGKLMTGEEAAKQPYYSTVDGQPFSVPLDFEKEVPKGEDTGFNTDELSKENDADTQAYRQSLTAHEIATRQPSRDVVDKVTKKKSTVTPPNDPSRLSGLASLEEANNTPSGRGSATELSMKQKLVAAFADYKNTGLKLTQEDINNPDQAIEKIVNHIQDNYQWVYDNMPESIKKVAQQWYETVHNSTKAEAERTGLSHPQVAGIVAAYSPQNPWDNNRESAYKMIDLVQNQSNHEWSPEMDTTLQNIKDVNTTVKPGAPGLTNGQIAFGKLADAIRGKKFHDFDSIPDKEERLGLQALWLRTLDEAHTEDRSIPTMTPNGEITGHAGTRAWPGIDVMARGLDIIVNGQNADGTPNLELINEHLGGGNKVRNFYNNMINPWSERGHFTADTHQVGAGLLQAVSSKSVEAMHNFGSGNKKGIPSPGKNGPTGVKGTYPVYQEAGVRAAAENGVRPNQFQSMSWEGIRSLMGDDKKTPALEQAIRSIWEQHEEGKITIGSARKQILEASGGFNKPEWMSQAEWDADPSPNKAETVLANRPPERTPEAIVDAAKTRKVREQMEAKAQKNAEKADKAEQKAKGGGAKPAGKRRL